MEGGKDKNGGKEKGYEWKGGGRKERRDKSDKKQKRRDVGVECVCFERDRKSVV